MALKGGPQPRNEKASASDALPLPLYLTNAVFFTLFFSVAYYLLHRWRDKIRTSTPLHVVSLSELAAIGSLIASFIYLLGFFGIDFVQSFISRASHYDDTWDDDDLRREKPKFVEADPALCSEDDDEIIQAVVTGAVPSYSLESKLGDCKRAAAIRRAWLQRTTGRSLQELPLEGFDYDSILGQCCESPIGYVQIPVGIAGPLLLDGFEYMVPMATTEGCLVASMNRGCKAIHLSGGADSRVYRDGMTRAPVVGFASGVRACELLYYLENRANFDTLAVVFNRSSRFAKLQSIFPTLAATTVHIRFACSTGDAMGMNMVSKGVQNVLDYLQNDFPDMEVIGISGNFCSDKKPAAVNWILGRGKSVVCEAVIREEVIKEVLKTNAHKLVKLHLSKNFVGSAMAGSTGGYNAHASNIVSAIFIATGQDPAQNVESSHCLTNISSINDGKEIHASVTMPCIEVGTVGGGTQLASQSACLNMLGVKGASQGSPGSNSRRLATIIAGSVLAGELSLLSAMAAGDMVKSHMKYNRSSKDVSSTAS
ncbi:3-hydroxy-3-methylglutaryl-coenzyme A reductase 1-like [Argentina anserina]|uniref:3-hydroxy-3-methylglutaryl-coenzyme A reductase 1-like n=1 Tax=Argentina anserina TaxID=57926 RepID=UPI002176320A|nr:3-hydroxy-3-methylglutaryl-coenzyme A reductase 1-like [Potentilla anserina]